MYGHQLYYGRYFALATGIWHRVRWKLQIPLLTKTRSLSSEPQAVWRRTSAQGEKSGSHFAGFRILKTESELVTVLQRLSPLLSARDISAGFYRLSQYDRPPKHQTLEFLTEKAIRHAPAMSAYDVTSVLKACSRLKWIEVPLFVRLAERLVQRECLFQLNGTIFSDCIASIAVLYKNPHTKWTRDDFNKATEIPSPFVFDTIMELTQWLLAAGLLENVRTSIIARVVHSYGMLQYQSPALLRALSHEIVKSHRIEVLRNNELTQVWKGLAQMKMSDTEVLQLVCGELSRTERLRGFEPWELETVLSASKELLPFREFHFLLKVVQEITKPDRLVAFSQAHLVNIISALNVLRLRDDGITNAILEEVMKRNRLPFFTQQHLASILCSMKSLGFGSHPAVQQLLPHAESIIHNKNLSNKQMLSFVFGKRRTEAEENICNKMVDELLTPQRLASLSDEELSGLFAGLYQRGMSDRSQTEVCKTEIVRRLKTATPQILSYYAYGLRVNRITSKDVLEAFVAEVSMAERLNEISPSQLAGIIYALGVLGWKESKTYRLLLDKLKPNLLQLSEQGLCNVVMAINLTQLEIDDTIEAILREATQRYRLLQATERCLISLVISFGKMRLLEKRFTLPVLEEVTKLGRLSRLTNQQLTNVIYNLTTTRVKTARTINNIKSEVLKPSRLPTMHRSELSNLVFGLGGISVQDEDIKTAIAEFITSSVDVTAFKNSELTNLIRGIGGLRCQDSGCLSKLLTEATQPKRMDCYTASEFSSMVYGMGRAVGVDQPCVERIAEACTNAERISQFTDQQLVHVFVSLIHLIQESNMTYFPQALLNEVTREERMKSFESYHLANIASVLGEKAFKGEMTTLAKALVGEVCKSERLETMTRVDLTFVSRFLTRGGIDDMAILKKISDALISRFLEENKKTDISTL